MDSHEDRPASVRPGNRALVAALSRFERQVDPYPEADPSAEVATLLNEVELDRTGIFWG